MASDRTAALLAVAERDRSGRALTKAPHVARAADMMTDEAEDAFADLADRGWVEPGRQRGSYRLADAGRERVLVILLIWLPEQLARWRASD